MAAPECALSPLLVVSGSAVLSSHADSLVYVIRSGATTSIRQAKNWLGQLQGFNAPMIAA